MSDVASKLTNLNASSLVESAVSRLRYAIDLLSREEAKAALQAASEACHRAPELPQCHYVYGQAWLALGAPQMAERAFAEAIQKSPLWADAWINFGIARYRQGAIADAKLAMKRVLDFAPGHAIASGNLAAFMRISGEAEAAEALMRDALDSEMRTVGARLNLAADLLSEERGSEALALLSQGEDPKDLTTFRHWLLQKALAQLQLRRTFDARLTITKIAELGPIPSKIMPLYCWRVTLLAIEEGDIERAREAAAAMEEAIAAMGTEAVGEHRIMAHFNLAKFWSGLGEAARAFANWTAAHKLLARDQPFSRGNHLNLVNATIEAFGHHRFTSGPRAENADPAPVFIVGMPRSGTTLCEQILASHRYVHGAGERGALQGLTHVLGGNNINGPRRIAELKDEALDLAGNSYLAELKALAPEKTRIVDKMPGNFLYLGLVGLILPGARIIHCVRDPRDVGLSIFTFRFYGAHPYAHDLGDLGWYIRQQDRLMSHWKAVLPNPILTVRISDWIEDFDATLERVLAHVDLPPDSNCVRFHEREARVRTVSRTQVRQPVNARGIGRWRAFAKELEPLISEVGLHK